MRNWKKKGMAVTMMVGMLALPNLINAEEMMVPKDNYSSIETVTIDGNELAPLRKVAESLGFQVTWNDMTRTVTLMKSMQDKKTIEDKKMMDDKNMQDKTMMDKSMDMDGKIMLHIDSKAITVGSMEEMLMVAPTIVNDMTYVPKAFIDTYLLNKMMMK
ncbi:copper amine oxidase N-terminal domain-containing protein [Paenibacillus chondroitinus]|uniref:Copper amine oxidase N-terminal domain-containing protein n=1 Tax=Paenibacillus chondroitinus TaxID=59842 RepID=A0ABU6DNI6_9BACL|nr:MULTISPECIES: copper amine oxidase N-terminal domain-containing protein [Paenibacillus]MCY9660720.1 copper amine oxidase N-terminal domain-containing protein [Paenibacillus anseongense]MEB4799081.1 copper amine oxidase N-terminal domain-containing protein [Paenibacillus chondroitinus]